MSGAFKEGAYFPLGCGTEMSEGGYQAMYELCEPTPPPPPSLDERRGYWRAKGGWVLKIAAMPTAHIENAIKLFEKAGWGEHEKIRELRAELGRRAL